MQSVSELDLPVQTTSSGAMVGYVNLLKNYHQRTQLLAEIERTLFDAIELFAGRSCREACESSGLEKLHLHYPAEHTNLLVGFVNRRMKRRMLQWTAEMGRNDLNFREEFLVQDLFVVRIHYPHGHIVTPTHGNVKPTLLQKVRYGFTSNLESLREVIESKAGLRRTWKTFKFLRRKIESPLAYRVHASHKDSWQGQSVGALSVWLAIAGLDKNNALCLYPETINTRLPVGKSRYLGSGCVLPKPTRPDIHDGDLLVFNTDTLHSGQVNVSDKTRIALTTRIDSGKPVFDPESLWHVQRWYSANDLLNGQLRLKKVRASEHLATYPTAQPEAEPSLRVRISSTYRPDTVHAVADTSLLSDGQKMAVEFDNIRILLLRTNGKLTAFSGKCPHGPYFLEDGYHDQCTLTCPGHGLEFNLQTGGSATKRYQLAGFEVHEKDGTIFLGGLRKNISK